MVETMVQDDPIRNVVQAMGREELMERREELLRKVRTMQWDKSLNQLHAGMKRKLDSMEKELNHIADALSKVPLAKE